MRVIATVGEQMEIVQTEHSGTGVSMESQNTGGHVGKNKLHKKLTERYYWPNMTKMAYGHVATCHKCQMVNPVAFKKPTATLHSIPVPGAIWSQVGIDLVGPLTEVHGYNYICSAMDYMSKYVEMKPLKHKTGAEAGYFVYELMCRYGVPDVIITDKGTEFVNELSTKLYKMTGCHHRITSPYHPQSNGLIERHNKTLTQRILKMATEAEDWLASLPSIAYSLRISEQASIKMSPMAVLLGRRPKTPAEFLQQRSAEEMALTEEEGQLIGQQLESCDLQQLENVRTEIAKVVLNNTAKAQVRQQRNYNKRHSTKVTLKVGDWCIKETKVEQRNKFRKGGKYCPKHIGPFLVDHIYDNGNYLLRTQGGNVYKTIANPEMVYAYSFPDASHGVPQPKKEFLAPEEDPDLELTAAQRAKILRASQGSQGSQPKKRRLNAAESLHDNINYAADYPSQEMYNSEYQAVHTEDVAVGNPTEPYHVDMFALTDEVVRKDSDGQHTYVKYNPDGTTKPLMEDVAKDPKKKQEHAEFVPPKKCTETTIIGRTGLAKAMTPPPPIAVRTAKLSAVSTPGSTVAKRVLSRKKVLTSVPSAFGGKLPTPSQDSRKFCPPRKQCDPVSTAPLCTPQIKQMKQMKFCPPRKKGAKCSQKELCTSRITPEELLVKWNQDALETCVAAARSLSLDGKVTVKADVQIIGQIDGPVYPFIPMSTPTSREKVSKAANCLDTEEIIPYLVGNGLCDGPPDTVKSIAMDGNCLFRALSYAVCGNQDLHDHLRMGICNMYLGGGSLDKAHDDLMTGFLGSSPKEYLHKTKMAYQKKWGTEREIQMAAQMLQCDIFVWSVVAATAKCAATKRWFRFWPPFNEDWDLKKYDRAIYLSNTSSHFEVVLSIHHDTVASGRIPRVRKANPKYIDA